MWDRYLSYGAALGITPVVSRAADLAVGTREVLWSDYTGTWRQVRVRYPRRGRSSGCPPTTVIVNGLLVVGLAALLGGRSLYRIVRAAQDRLAP